MLDGYIKAKDDFLFDKGRRKELLKQRSRLRSELRHSYLKGLCVSWSTELSN